ncbi:MAG: hypothetical protein MZV65_12755 [Chromatiales bacterium]|nr:hypothetical protein [Chromatiales bacterium]
MAIMALIMGGAETGPEAPRMRQVTRNIDVGGLLPATRRRGSIARGPLLCILHPRPCPSLDGAGCRQAMEARMMGIVIKGGRLIDPGSLDAVKDLYIDSTGFVAGVGNKPDGFEPEPHASTPHGRIVCPGLVDLRARLREPGLEHKATIGERDPRRGRPAASPPCAARPTPGRSIDTPAMAQMIQSRAWRFGLAFVHPLGALTQRLEGKLLTDMAALDEAGCVGVSNAARTRHRHPGDAARAWSTPPPSA